MTSVVLFGVGCILDILLAKAFSDSFGENGHSVLGTGYIPVSPWYFFGVAAACAVIQVAVALFGAYEYEQGEKMDGNVIASAIFFLLPILYFLMFIFTEYLYTRNIVNMEFATGTTLMLNFMFVWFSVMTLLLQVFVENERRKTQVLAEDAPRESNG
ncbi:MAG: hypothetical protein HGB34_03010 [Candidatus Moranbacteria bacterium]|nr:hypothetical protein [Candidatus Moranbacteria bacterium]